jgi:hypothetical protein
LTICPTRISVARLSVAGRRQMKFLERADALGAA